MEILATIVLFWLWIEGIILATGAIPIVGLGFAGILFLLYSGMIAGALYVIWYGWRRS